jgi:hypothetical protein
MKEGAHIALAAAARFYTPLMALFALALLALRPAGGGVGFVAGLAFVLVLLTHVLVFGAVAARAAAPPIATRLLMALGLAALVAGATLPVLFAPQLVEGGLFVVMAAGGALMIAVIVGRAPTMRDEAL